MKSNMSKIESFTINFEVEKLMAKKTSAYRKEGEGVVGATGSSQDLAG